MTTEHSNEIRIPEETVSLKIADRPETPELETIIREVLEQHDGLCMDQAEEREQLSAALAVALGAYRREKSVAGGTDIEVAT